MAVYNIYFSPTGGTKRAAEIVSRAICENAVDINTIKIGNYQREFSAEDLCVISVPSFGGRVPAAALERISQMKGNGAKAVLLVAFGNRAIDDTMLELKDATDTAGFKTIAGIEAVTEHSMARKIATGRPDADDEKALIGFAEQIKAAAENPSAEPAIPGNRPFKEFAGGAKPKADENCVACGLCAAECPAGAIDPAAPQTTDKTKCISCMRCISVCPQGARKVNPAAAAAVEGMLMKVCAGRKENKLYL